MRLGDNPQQSSNVNAQRASFASNSHVTRGPRLDFNSGSIGNSPRYPNRHRQSSPNDHSNSGSNGEIDSSKHKIPREVEDEIARVVTIYVEHNFPVRRRGFIVQIANAVLERRGMDIVAPGWEGGFMTRHPDIGELTKKARDDRSKKDKRSSGQDAQLNKFLGQVEKAIKGRGIQEANIYAMGELGCITTIKKLKQKQSMTLKRPPKRTTSTLSTRRFSSVMICIRHSAYSASRAVSPIITAKTNDPPSHEHMAGVRVAFDETGWASTSHTMHWLTKKFNPETKPRAGRGEPCPWRLLLVDAHLMDDQLLAQFQIYCWYERIICLSFPLGASEILNPVHCGVFATFGDRFAEHMSQKWTAAQGGKKHTEYSLEPRAFVDYVNRHLSSSFHETAIGEAWLKSCLVPKNSAGLKERLRGAEKEIIDISDEEAHHTPSPPEQTRSTSRRRLILPASFSDEIQLASPPPSSQPGAEGSPSQSTPMKREGGKSAEASRARQEHNNNNNNQIIPSDPPLPEQHRADVQENQSEEGNDETQSTASDVVELPASNYASEKSSHRKRLCEFKDCSPSKAPRILRQLLDDRMELYIKYQMYKRELELLTDI